MINHFCVCAGNLQGAVQFQFHASSGRFELPVGYVSGTSMSGGLTLLDVTVADLGITPAEYAFGGGQTISIQDATVAIPEPSSLALLGMGGIGGIGLIGYWRRKRRKNA